MNEFYNPFHFVPVAASQPELLPRAALQSPPTQRDSHSHDHVTHDRYVAGTHSGRIVCRLRLDTPTVIGARRDPSQSPALVEPYEVLAERDGKLELEPAIPATSLRGMVSSVFEAITNSALRVLKDTPLSIRARAMRGGEQEPSEALQAVGMIHVDDQGRRWLLPLAFPMLPASRSARERQNTRPDQKRFEIEPPWRPYENFLALKIYLGQQDNISTTADDRRVYFLEDPGFFAPRAHCVSGVPDARDKGGFKGGLIGRFKRAYPITRQQWLSKPAAERARFIPGVIRNLGQESDAKLQATRSPKDNKSRRDTKELPGNVKYGWFIPLHKSVYDAASGEWVYEQNNLPLIDAEAAVEEFEALAKQRTLADLRLPFELLGSMRNNDEKRKDENETHVIKLRKGDLVCFDLTAAGKIGRLSISSIWRKPAGHVWDWFSQVNPNLVPMNARRTELTLAEQLFGFVESPGVESAAAADRVKALAGRLTFSEGRLCSPQAAGGPYEGEGITPILATPKPPAPLLYFQHQGGGPVKKSALPRQAGKGLRPKGRKWYLHHRQAQWQTAAPDEHPEQKTRIRPLKAGLEFVFDIDFTNLSETELALLLYALQPTPTFRHRLGLGKPLGLGTVRVQTLGAFFVDRAARYREGDLFGPQRYHAVAVSEEQAGCPLELPHAAVEVQGRYGPAIAAWPAAPDAAGPWSTLHRQAIEWMTAWKLDDIRAAVEALGDPATTGEVPVHYPRLPDEVLPRREDGTADLESELFRWHMWNEERPVPQFLRPLSSGRASPDTLRRVAPFKFFVYATLNEQQQRSVYELLRPAYPGAIVPAEPHDVRRRPEDYQQEVRQAQDSGLICIHLGIRQDRDWPEWAVTVSNHKPIDALGRNQEPTDFRRELKKYLPGTGERRGV